MRASAASPMAPWRSRPLPAASLRGSPIGSPTGGNFKIQGGGSTWAVLRSSLPGLTRQSIHLCKKLLAKKMDARVKPAHDWLEQRISIAGLIHRRELAAAEIHHARGQAAAARDPTAHVLRSEEHTSDSSHLVISYAVFCL